MSVFDTDELALACRRGRIAESDDRDAAFVVEVHATVEVTTKPISVRAAIAHLCGQAFAYMRKTVEVFRLPCPRRYMFSERDIRS